MPNDDRLILSLNGGTHLTFARTTSPGWPSANLPGLTCRNRGELEFTLSETGTFCLQQGNCAMSGNMDAGDSRDYLLRLELTAQDSCFWPPGGAAGPVTYSGLGIQEAGAVLLAGFSQSGTSDIIRGLFPELSPIY